MFAPPAVAGDLVFVGSCAGTFYALDIASGNPRWTYDVRRDGKQSSFHGAFLIANQHVFFDTDRSCDPSGIGHVYAAEQATGRVTWKYPSPVGVSSNLIQAGGSVCFGTTSGEWGCLDRDSGKLKWKSARAGARDCKLPTWATTDGERLYIITADAAVAALKISDGKLMWKRQLAGRATTSPVLNGRRLYVGADDSQIYALDNATGAVRQSASVNGKPVGRPSVAGQLLLFVLERSGASRGGLIALEPTSMRVKWEIEHNRSFASEQPLVRGDVAIVGDCSGIVNAFSCADGAPRWSTRVKGCIRSIGSSGELIFLGAQEGTVYAIRP